LKIRYRSPSEGTKKEKISGIIPEPVDEDIGRYS